MRTISKTKVLIAVTGMSPAILTETVWALAQGDDPWIPDQVIAITTRTGKAVIEELLMDGDGWGQLRSALTKKGLPVDGALVNRFTQIAPDPANYPPVRIDLNAGVCRIGESSVRLSPPEFALLLIIAQQIKAGHPLLSWYDLELEMKALFARKDIPLKADWFHSVKEGEGIDTDDFRKLASSARAKLRRVFQHLGLADAFVPSMRRKTDDLYPASKIKITDIR